MLRTTTIPFILLAFHVLLYPLARFDSGFLFGFILRYLSPVLLDHPSPSVGIVVVLTLAIGR